MNHFRPSNVFLLREEVCRDGQNICEQQQQQHGDGAFKLLVVDLYT